MGVIWKHFCTVVRHKAIVFKECCACGIFWRGLVHDISKFSPTEFISSARFFQGNSSPIEAEKHIRGYSVAWQRHIGHNPHHWEYWIDFFNDGTIIANRIPYIFVVEMVCDWIGAGKVYSKEAWTQHEPLAYYNKVRAGRHIHPDTEALILEFLTCIDISGLSDFHRMAKGLGSYAHIRANYIQQSANAYSIQKKVD